MLRRAVQLDVSASPMTQPFTCAHCGITTRKRAHFMWVAAVVGFFFGQNWVNTERPLCTRCAPSWATTFGRVVYVLLAIGILLLLWQVLAPKGEKGVTPNRLLSDASASALSASFGAPNRDVNGL